MGLNEKHARDAAVHQGLTLQPGTRVLDSVTGDTGTVDIGTVRLEQIPAGAGPQPAGSSGAGLAIATRTVERWFVKLDSGISVMRRREQLQELPAELRADIEDFSA